MKELIIGVQQNAIRKVMNSRGEDVTDFLIDKVEAEVRREIMSGLEGEGLPPMAE